MHKELRKDFLSNVRAEFERRRDEKDLEKIKYFLAVGKRDLLQVRNAVDLAAGNMR